MYNTKYVCLYHININFTEDMADYEIENIRDVLYREDIFNIFNISNFDIFNTRIPELHRKLINHNKFKELMKTAAAMLFSEETEVGLCVLYSYDFMHLTHKCVCEYLDKGSISEENICLLNECINN